VNRREPRGRSARKADAPRGGAPEVVASDGDEAVVFKVAGLSSERPDGSANGSGDSLITRARARLGWPDAQLPHRLDRPTRGLVMVSRDRAVAARHAAEIRSGAWTKWYVARIPTRSADGSSRPASEIVGPYKAFLRREGAKASVVRSGGDPSRLTVVAVAPATDFTDESHALVLLETGRFHQIRAMLANIGFALVGDLLYGGVRRRGDSLAEIPDLEAIALRIARPEGARVFRLPVHRDRVGVAAAIEQALDQAIAAASDEPGPRAPRADPDR
jgi:23S rRNA pseudouridine1911/1915/1917 synthase